MERFTAVEQKNTLLTKEGLCKTVETTERSLRICATHALRGTRQLGGSLQSSPLIEELVLVLKPIFQ